MQTQGLVLAQESAAPGVDGVQVDRESSGANRIQIDHPYLDTQSNGLSHLIEKMQGQRLYAHVNLQKGERSELAELANRLGVGMVAAILEGRSGSGLPEQAAP